MRLFLCALFLVSSLFCYGQTSAPTKHKKANKAPTTVYLSNAMRHVALDYLEYVDKDIYPDALGQEHYTKLLDQMDQSLNIDAAGADRSFFELVLKPVRLFGVAESITRTRRTNQEGWSDEQRTTYAKFSTLAAHYVHCKVLADEMVEYGKLEPFGDCDIDVIYKEVDAAVLREEQKIKSEQELAKAKMKEELAKPDGCKSTSDPSVLQVACPK